jgi:hypothetical protein
MTNKYLEKVAKVVEAETTRTPEKKKGVVGKYGVSATVGAGMGHVFLKGGFKNKFNEKPLNKSMHALQRNADQLGKRVSNIATTPTRQNMSVEEFLGSRERAKANAEISRVGGIAAHRAEKIKGIYDKASRTGNRLAGPAAVLTGAAIGVGMKKLFGKKDSSK